MDKNSARCPLRGHVALNAFLLSPRAGYRNAGVSQYIQALLRTLPAARHDLQLSAYIGAGVAGDFPGWQVRRSRLPGDRPPLRILWEQLLQPAALRRAGVDLVHAPVNVGPLVRACPMVVTVHDLSFLLYPETFQPAQRLYQRTLARRTAQRAERVIAVSESTRRDLVRHFGVPAERITVVPNGVDAAFRPLPAAEVAAFRRERGLPERFLLCVATLEPRKNLPRLLEAVARVPEAPLLVLCGGKGWYYDTIFATIERLGLQRRVHLPGFIPAAELPLWYNAATWFVYPSLYEGFGLPALQALACGTPAIVSHASSLPEVVGDAAILVDPLDVEAMAAALAQALPDGALAGSLREAGLARAAQFPWSRTAEETVAVYRAVLSREVGRA
ncbi:MAG TPA: glycosyltransferase family 1 protein [Anaerolineae bacterium]|nr:glycosyltransferase family 1 protein [Anaerolineae bacterium]HOR00479.1 glycosyltransferase family 1 protein [Anaerolineae bacterium]HPL28363.1 glycosyltransferase family 1 protein [Anaerolineae bacterium]